MPLSFFANAANWGLHENVHLMLTSQGEKMPSAYSLHYQIEDLSGKRLERVPSSIPNISREKSQKGFNRHALLPPKADLTQKPFRIL